MIGILIDFVVSIVGGVVATAIYDAIKNKKNNRPKSGKLDDSSSH